MTTIDRVRTDHARGGRLAAATEDVQSPVRESPDVGTADPSVSERSSRLRRLSGGLAATVFYFVVACMAYWPDGPLTSGRIVTRPRSDLAQGAWFVEWFAYSITHGLSPFFTNYMLAPQGANLALDNTSPLLGLLVTPVTLTAGPLVAFNLLFRLGLAFSGLGVYCMLRRYTKWWPAALLGGLVFELCPYTIGHAHKHVFLTWLVFVPFMILVVDDWLVSRRRGPIASGALLGLLGGLEFLVSVEVLVDCVIFFAIGLVYLAARHRHEVSERLAALFRGAVPAVIVFGGLAGYPLYLMMFGPRRPSAGLHDLSNLAQYHGDVLAPFLPTRYVWWHFTNAAANFVYASPSENGFYIGVPLFVLIAYLVWRFRRDTVVATSAVVMAAAFVLGLGPRLYVDNRSVFSPMPFALISHLPLLKNLEAARMSLFIWLGAVTILAVGLDRLRAGGWRLGARGEARAAHGRWRTGGNRSGAAGWTVRARSLLVGGIFVVSLLPALPSLPLMSKGVTEPAFFTVSSQLDMIPKGDVVLTFPYNRAPYDSPMLWQAMSGMRFRILGGEATVPGPGGVALGHAGPSAPAPLARLLLSGWPQPDGQWDRNPPHGPDLVPMIRSYVRQNGVEDVLVSQHSLHSRLVAELMTEAFGKPPVVVGDVDLWLHVRSDLDALHTDVAPSG